jgi:DNA-directed RNA polymerase specialized sigma24 family protein
MMRRIVAKLKATASDDQVTKTATEQQEEAIYAYIDALPELQRTMILLRHRDGQTYAQIAESLGLGKKVVLKSLAKIYAGLRISLEPSG